MSVHNIEEHSFIISQSGYCKCAYLHNPRSQSFMMHIGIIKSLECLGKCIIMVFTQKKGEIQFMSRTEQTIYNCSLNNKSFIRSRWMKII